MGFSCGIVGLPNVGKSTIFNALTNGKAIAANFPFCTIEPNTGTIPVPDPRLYELANMVKSARTVPTKIHFVDIAGLIKGAAKGEGLGNQFLGHIRNVDAIVHIVRCFEDANTIHVDSTVDPIRDAEVILTELIIADLDVVSKQLEKAQKASKSGNEEILKQINLLTKLSDFLGRGETTLTFLNQKSEELSKDEVEFIKRQGLLTSKAMLVVGNLSEEQIALPLEEIPQLKLLKEFAQKNSSKITTICGKLESEIAELPETEQLEYKDALGLKLNGLEQITLNGYEMLQLITFFTVGPQETRAWTATAGSNAAECAGKIHTDFSKNFIRAEVISYDDYIKYNGELGAKEAGKMRLEGKEYIVADGDVIFFRVGK